MRFIGTYLFAVAQNGASPTNTSTLHSLQRRLSSSTSFGVCGINTSNTIQVYTRSHTDSSLFRRNMSSSADDTQKCVYRYDDTTMSLIEESKYPYQLIDVDCNLLHEDLTSILAVSTDDIYDGAKSNVNLRILHHPSTVASNVQGVFSPSSTIDEAESFHRTLVDITDTPQIRNHIDVRMSVGVHPYHAEEAGDITSTESEIRKRVQLLMKNDEGLEYITCIGETGLDYSEGFPEKEKQLPWFTFQIKLAKEYNLPLFIHERLAFEDTTRIIDENFPDEASCPPIIVHCFTGNREECKSYIKRGYHISVSGFILKNGDGPEEVKACLREGIIPLDKLMVETDAPYMGFNMCRVSFYKVEEVINDDFMALKSKKRKNLVKGQYPNVPSSLPQVMECAVDLMNEGRRNRGEDEISIEDSSKIIFDNSAKFFSIKPTN